MSEEIIKNATSSGFFLWLRWQWKLCPRSRTAKQLNKNLETRNGRRKMATRKLLAHDDEKKKYIPSVFHNFQLFTSGRADYENQETLQQIESLF